VELALAGDIQAWRLCMARLAPPRRDRLVEFELPPARNLDEIAQAMNAVLAAIS